MSRSEFREISECDRCGCSTAAEVEYFDEGVKVVLQFCKNCDTRKKTKNVQNKLSKFAGNKA